MRNPIFGIAYILLVIVQMVICNYFQFSPYFVISILPAMVLCIPLTIPTHICMLIAFATGLSVDWLAEGLIGINASALIPVAYARKTLIRIFLGEDLISRKETFSFRKNGVGKILTALAVTYLMFFALYIFLDGAGTKTFSFNFLRFILSLLLSLILGLIVTGSLTKEERK